MSRFIITSLFIAMTLCHSVFGKQVEFNQSTFDKLKQNYKDKQWLMILWSVDCPACFKELALIKKLRKSQPDLPIVIINADDSDEVANERVKVMLDYQMDDLTNYHFTDGQGDSNRFMVDSNWYGELPRSYFVEANGKFHGKSGLLKEELIKKWLNIN